MAYFFKFFTLFYNNSIIFYWRRYTGRYILFLYFCQLSHIIIIAHRLSQQFIYFTRYTLENEIKCCAEKVGLESIRVHDLRHSHTSMLIEMGFEPLEITERLEHESVKTTLDTYSLLYPSMDQKLAERLNKLRYPKI